MLPPARRRTLRRLRVGRSTWCLWMWPSATYSSCGCCTALTFNTWSLPNIMERSLPTVAPLTVRWPAIIAGMSGSRAWARPAMAAVIRRSISCRICSMLRPRDSSRASIAPRDGQGTARTCKGPAGVGTVWLSSRAPT